MMFACYYDSPLGKLLLTADALGLTGLYFDGENTEADRLVFARRGETPLLAGDQRWLDVYFSGSQPDFLPPLHPAGSAFRQAVWALLLQIPYGQTTTYGAIARQLAAKQGIPKMSAQAVGGAIGDNKIAIVIPCHRVIGANGSLTGYAGGTNRKAALLELEHTDMTGLFLPKKGLARER